MPLPRPIPCFTCNKVCKFNLGKLSADNMGSCPWCHTPLRAKIGSFTRCAQHQLICPRQPKKEDLCTCGDKPLELRPFVPNNSTPPMCTDFLPPCNWDDWEDWDVVDTPSSNEHSTPTPALTPDQEYKEKEKLYKPCFDFVNYLMKHCKIKYPLIPSCVKCNDLIQYRVTQTKPLCPYCLKWLHMGRGSATAIVLHRDTCPNFPELELVCRCDADHGEHMNFTHNHFLHFNRNKSVCEN